MKNRHKYEYKIDLDSDHVGAKIFRLVGNEKRVLEIGAGPGSITRLLKEHGQCRVTAIELDSAAIDKLQAFCEQVYQCDLNTSDWPSTVSTDGKFQVVVAADVLEHLYDPWSTLRAMKTVLSDDGYIVVSLPHIGHEAALASMASGDFEYHDWGLLDRTHIRFFGIKNMQRLFNESGLKIVDAEFLVRAPELTEFAKVWAETPDELKRCLENTRFAKVYQVVIKAVPLDVAGPNLNLMALPVPSTISWKPPGASIMTQFKIVLKLLARRFLSQRSRARWSEILMRFGLRF